MVGNPEESELQEEEEVFPQWFQGENSHLPQRRSIQLHSCDPVPLMCTYTLTVLHTTWPDALLDLPHQRHDCFSTIVHLLLFCCCPLPTQAAAGLSSSCAYQVIVGRIAPPLRLRGEFCRLLRGTQVYYLCHTQLRTVSALPSRSAFRIYAFRTIEHLFAVWL